jgi:hypothetical protein
MEAAEDATIRERLELHRASPRCAGCHDIMDPPGLGLEEFDGIGRHRETENGAPIDTSGGIPGGAAFQGGAELAALVKEDPRFYSCLTNKLMTYGLGRRVATSDAPFVDDVVMGLEPGATTLNQMIERIVLSPAFRMRSLEASDI